MLENYDQLNDAQIDVLQEIGNIGAGNAATALSLLLNEKVSISVPKIQLTDFNAAINALGGTETMTVGVLVNYSGEANGIIMFLLNMEDAKRITNILVQGNSQGDELDEMKLSAIQEIGNILGSAYINSISALTGLSIRISIPYTAIDMAGALMSVPLIEFGAIGDKVMFIEENFSSGTHSLISHIIIFAEIDTLKTMMERLGM
ncbi:MAG: CheY-P-specific phosphatase CheC [Firmicutes bacterium HGW-Firmicutes-6]|nr:MAG: CheY-P-specific phosphatase CheC [Firmicutes bacterium HGW-Firmicutes-6]